jgi:hypothetical protein
MRAIFDLEPIAAAPGAIAAITSLGDDSGRLAAMDNTLA